MTRAIQIGGALLLAALIAGCGGLTPAEEERPVEQPVDGSSRLSARQSP